MRKMSKGRTEEDTVSSTNGSLKEVTNGGPPSDNEVEKDDEVVNNRDDSADETAKEAENEQEEKETTPAPRDPPKKRASKARGRPSKKGEVDENNEAEEEEEDSPKKTASKTRGRPPKKAVVDESDGDEEEEYEVEQVIDSKNIRGKKHYLIRWKGYSASSDTWEPADTVSCPELIKKFEEGEKKSPKKAVKRKSSEPVKKAGKKGRSSKQTKTKARPPKAKDDFDYENADKNAEYEVERIMEVHHKKNGKREFLIHWKGWSSRHDSWEPEEHLNCSELIEKFMSKVSSAREKDTRELRVAPETTQRFTLAQRSTGRRLSKRSNNRQRVRYDGAE